MSNAKSHRVNGGGGEEEGGSKKEGIGHEGIGQCAVLTFIRSVSHKIVTVLYKRLQNLPANRPNL